jgi:hypothetical protein
MNINEVLRIGALEISPIHEDGEFEIVDEGGDSGFYHFMTTDEAELLILFLRDSIDSQIPDYTKEINIMFGIIVGQVGMDAEDFATARRLFLEKHPEFLERIENNMKIASACGISVEEQIETLKLNGKAK